MKPIDTSIFSATDAFNIGLQRTAHFKSRLAFKLWARGWSSPLRLEATLRRRSLIEGALSDAEREFEEIASYLGAHHPARIVVTR